MQEWEVTVTGRTFSRREVDKLWSFGDKNSAVEKFGSEVSYAARNGLRVAIYSYGTVILSASY